MWDVQVEFKLLMIDALGLEDITPDDMCNDMTLLGEGLGLDTVEARGVGQAIKKRYGF
ncbi:acyl carrier protein, partial [Pseudomonas syringae pv. tagetis]